MTHRHRGERLGELFRRELTRLLMGPLKDPRLDGASVTAVRATRDLSSATVFVRTDDPAELGDAIEGFERASGFIRGELGRSLRLRKIPEFRFRPDETPEHASRIEVLLQQVRDDAPPGEEDRGDGNGDGPRNGGGRRTDAGRQGSGDERGGGGPGDGGGWRGG